MSVLLVTHERYFDHDTGRGHVERPARLSAVLDGIAGADLDEAVVRVPARAATPDDLAAVHSPEFVDVIERFCRAGGGRLDPDTVAVPASWEAALLAAGAGLEAIRRLDAGEASAAFCAVRPPGHHARPSQAMGFCLFNNLALAAATLAERGERVLVLDWDAHHGNGTQEAFYADPRVIVVSIHQSPLYPGTGRIDETGTGAGVGTTVNVPVPPGATGDVVLRTVDEVVAPLVESAGVSWVLVSAGFDAHRADPLTDMGLSAGDFGLLSGRVCELVPPGRRLLFLEGGYDLDALAASAGACLAALAGQAHESERPTAGGPGADVVAEVVARQQRL